MRQLPQHPTKPNRPFPHRPLVRALQPMQRIDQHKRVLIDRIPVIGIPNHQRIDPMKLRNQQLQHTERMHRPKRIPGIKTRQNSSQMMPQRRTLLQMRRQQRQPTFQPLLCIAPQSTSRLRHRAKHLEHHIRILRRFTPKFTHRSQHHAAPLHAKTTLRCLDLLLPLQRLPLRSPFPYRDFIQHLLHAPFHAARVPKIHPHPISCIRLLRPPARQTHRSLRGRILSLPVQRIVISLMPVVQKTPHQPQKLHRLTKLAPLFGRHRRSHASSVALLRYLSGNLEQTGHPPAHMRIAQSARAILDIRLQVKQRVAILSMARPRQFQQLQHHRLVVPLQQLRNALSGELLIQLPNPPLPCGGPSATAQTPHSPDPTARTPPASASPETHESHSPTSPGSRAGSHPSHLSLPASHPAKRANPHPKKETAPAAHNHPPQRAPPRPQPRIPLHRLLPQTGYQLIDRTCTFGNRLRPRSPTRLERTTKPQHRPLILSPQHARGVVSRHTYLSR